jgi:hypothetical protein
MLIYTFKLQVANPRLLSFKTTHFSVTQAPIKLATQAEECSLHGEITMMYDDHAPQQTVTK